MKLLIVRHAESEGNSTGNYSTAIADSLSDVGRDQASALVACLKPWSFDKIIVSPLQRVLETITPYLAATHQRAEIWPELAEACWHDEREAPSECWRAQPASLPDSLLPLFAYRDHKAVRPAHPESFGEGLRRVLAATEHMHAMPDQTIESILMVTHGHFIRELLNVIFDTRRTVDFAQENCGMTLLSFNGAWKMDFCNRQTQTILHGTARQPPLV